MLKGTDLSAVQGVLPDSVWAELEKQGLRFAFLRAVVGNETWVDGSAVENAKRARDHGILVAPYFFFYPLPHLDPGKQAEWFVSKLEGMKLGFDIPPMGDCEWPAREEWKVIDGVKKLTYPWQKWGCSAPQIREWVLKCFQRGEELTGCSWLLYSYRYWLQCIEAEKTPELAQRPLVLADYKYAGRWPTDEEIAQLAAPKPWDQITFLQHDGNGGLKLPNGVDADFDCFLGDETQLRSLSMPVPAGDPLPEDVSPPVDIEAAKQREIGYMLDDMIEDYRRRRRFEEVA